MPLGVSVHSQFVHVPKISRIKTRYPSHHRYFRKVNGIWHVHIKLDHTPSISFIGLCGLDLYHEHPTRDTIPQSWQDGLFSWRHSVSDCSEI